MLGFDEEEREFTKKRNHEEEHRCGTDSCDSGRQQPRANVSYSRSSHTRRFQDFMTLVFGHGDAGGWSLSLWVTDGVPTNTGAQTCVGELWPQLPLTMSGRVARSCCVSVKLRPISWCSALSPQRSATRSDAHRRGSASLLMMFKPASAATEFCFTRVVSSVQLNFSVSVAAFAAAQVFTCHSRVS